MPVRRVKRRKKIAAEQATAHHVLSVADKLGHPIQVLTGAQAKLMFNQVISHTGFDSPCATNGGSFRIYPRWSNGPRLHGGTPIGFVPASMGVVYIESILSSLLMFHPMMLRRSSILSFKWPWACLTIF